MPGETDAEGADMPDEERFSERARSKSDRVLGTNLGTQVTTVGGETKPGSDPAKRADEPAAAGDVRIDAEPTGELLGEQD